MSNTKCCNSYIHLLCPVVFVLLILCPVELASSPLGLDGSDVIFHRKGPDTLSRYGFVNVVSLRDVNYDGFDDIAFSSNKPDYYSHICLGGNPSDTITDYYVRGIVWGAGDFTGDGISEVVSSFVFAPFQRDSGIVWFYRGYGDSIASTPYDSLWSVSGNFGRGEVVRFADVDSDSLSDMAVIATHGPDSPRIYFYSGGVTLDTIPEWSVGPPASNSHYLEDPCNFGFIDWNGDGWQDIYIGWHAYLDSTSFVALYFGPSFAGQPDRKIWTPLDSGINDPEFFAGFVSTVGDVDGDGFDDLAVESYDRILIYAGGPDADTLYDYRNIPRCSRASRAGDVNGDGANDLLLGRSLRQSHGGIEVLLGGQEWDEVSDGWLIRSDLPPYFLDQIGHRVSTAGDFNGDGYDDLLFSTLNFTSDDVGDVFVAAGGIDVVTDVADSLEDRKQTSFSLEIFPNPFNLSTSIKFTLRSAASGTLRICNVLGQTVNVIFSDRRLPAGTSNYEWDGSSFSGEAPSGIYFCNLEINGQIVNRKLLLLK